MYSWPPPQCLTDPKSWSIALSGTSTGERIGVEVVIVRVNDRGDALNEDNAKLVAGAGLIYMSGGNPGYLADTLRDSQYGKPSCANGAVVPPSRVAALVPWQ